MNTQDNNYVFQTLKAIRGKKDHVPLKEITFANPKSASFTDPLASTNMLAHLISLTDEKERQILEQREATITHYDT